MRWHTHERERRRSTSRTGPHLRRIPARTAGHPRLAPRAANNTGNERREYASSPSPPPAASPRRKFSPVFMFTPLITPLYPSFLSLCLSPLRATSPLACPLVSRTSRLSRFSSPLFFFTPRTRFLARAPSPPRSRSCLLVGTNGIAPFYREIVSVIIVGPLCRNVQKSV